MPTGLEAGGWITKRIWMKLRQMPTLGEINSQEWGQGICPCLPLLMAWTVFRATTFDRGQDLSQETPFSRPHLIPRLHQLHSFSWPLAPRDMDVFLLQWIFRGLSISLFLLYLHLYRSWLCNFQMYIFNSSPLAGPEFWLRKSWVSFHTRYQLTCLFLSIKYY